MSALGLAPHGGQQQHQHQHHAANNAQVSGPPHPSSSASISSSSAAANSAASASASTSSSSSAPASSASQSASFPSRLYGHVLDLTASDKREAALLELSKKREDFPDLAPILWHSFGTIAALLQEIVSIYPLLAPPRLTPAISNRCCNALALLQCVASHPETRSLFLNSHLGLFLYPFLNTVCTLRQYEYLRLTSLGVIGALVKVDDSEVINFLLQTEIIPLCLRIMDNGSELSKTVATFIIQKILLDEMGLSYICATYERFHTVSAVLTKMVRGLEDRPSVRLLKHIVRCYLRLSENGRARDALRTMLPTRLRDGAFNELLKDDPVTKRWLAQLLFNLDPPHQQSTAQHQTQQTQNITRYGMAQQTHAGEQS